MKKLLFKLGADPEFCIVLQNKLVPASDLLRVLFSGTGEEANMGYKVGKHGILGWDGAAATGEIRPSPSNDPEQLTKNIGKLFEYMTNKTELFSLSTLSDKAPIGGHIHFELPENKTGAVTVSNIHKKMMSFYIPVMLGENNLNLRMRNRQNYGKITDHRKDEHDGAMTYEFRVPSAEWITTPKVAEATLCYMACVYNEILFHPKNFQKNRNLITKNEAQARALQELTLANFEALTSVICGKVKKALRSFELYEAYKEQIEFILNPKKVIKEKERVDYNIVLGWDLDKNSNPTKRQLMSDKQLKERASKVDLDSLSGLISVQFNPDENVDIFVRAIKHRIIAMNWKLKNNYFLFGLKKGIKSPMVKNRYGEFLSGQEQIKTARDLQIINSTFDRMSGRFSSNTPTIAERTEEKLKSEMIIGLPYDMRIGQEHKKLIDLIHQIEKGKMEGELIDKNSLLNDTDTEPSKQGKIWKIYSRAETNSIRSVNTERAEAAARSEAERMEREARVMDDESTPEDLLAEDTTRRYPF